MAERIICFTKTGRARVDEKGTEPPPQKKKQQTNKQKKKKKKQQQKKQKNKKNKNKKKNAKPTRHLEIQYASVRTKKDGTALLHSTNTSPTITSKYAFMVISRINILLRSDNKKESSI